MSKYSQIVCCPPDEDLAGRQELTEDSEVNSVRMIPADLFIFADGFENGDTSVWDATVQ